MKQIGSSFEEMGVEGKRVKSFHKWVQTHFVLTFSCFLTFIPLFGIHKFSILCKTLCLDWDAKKWFPLRHRLSRRGNYPTRIYSPLILPPLPLKALSLPLGLLTFSQSWWSFLLTPMLFRCSCVASSSSCDRTTRTPIKPHTCAPGLHRLTPAGESKMTSFTFMTMNLKWPWYVPFPSALLLSPRTVSYCFLSPSDTQDFLSPSLLRNLLEKLKWENFCRLLHPPSYLHPCRTLRLVFVGHRQAGTPPLKAGLLIAVPSCLYQDRPRNSPFLPLPLSSVSRSVLTRWYLDLSISGPSMISLVSKLTRPSPSFSCWAVSLLYFHPARLFEFTLASWLLSCCFVLNPLW